MFHIRIFFIFLFLFTLNCSPNKVSNNHGYTSLQDKFDKISINKTNKNDILNIIGPPSSISNFNNDKWFYIERKITNTSILTFGKKKLTENNVLVLELNQAGLLTKKRIIDINNMNELEFAKNTTSSQLKGKSFLFNFMSSVRQKINDPIKKAITKKD